MVKANNLREMLKTSRMGMIEMGDKRKQRVKQFLQTTKGSFLLLGSQQRRLMTEEEIAKKEREEGTSLRTTVVIVEPTDAEPDIKEGSNNDNNKEPIIIKKKRKKGIINKWVSKMMASAPENNKIPPPPPPPLPSQEDKRMDIATLRSNSPLMDRKRSDGTIDTQPGEEEEDSDSLNDDEKAAAAALYHYSSDVHSHADTLDASTVVVSNRSNAMTRILCNMSGETTLREVNAWRNAACDLLLL